jgi:hypothetical protein
MTFEKFVENYFKGLGVVTNGVHTVKINLCDPLGTYIVINESGFGSIKIDKWLYDKIQREYKDFIELESKKEYVKGLERAINIVFDIQLTKLNEIMFNNTNKIEHMQEAWNMVKKKLNEELNKELNK